jgi:catechol 2,3-dioxygenase-like lactoylglutathione lyase family enzyme
MAMVLAQALQSVRFGAPDLAVMRAFLRDFGMVDADMADDGVLRMRGTGTAPFLHETVVGEPGLRAIALRVGGHADLEVLAGNAGVAVVQGPGGAMVSLRDPDGFVVEVVAGGTPVDPIAPPPPGAWNTIGARDRPQAPRRVVRGPAHVARLGHVVLGVSDVQATWDWWRSRFGLILSDEVRAPDGALASVFVRFDRGAEPTDHHSLNFATVPGRPAGFHHAAFEVADLDDLIVGHEFLKARGYTHDWGIGRHVLGSQVFDYWKDPWGHRVEHWTDGDVLAAESPAGSHALSVLLGQQWGPDAPADFV